MIQRFRHRHLPGQLHRVPFQHIKRSDRPSVTGVVLAALGRHQRAVRIDPDYARAELAAQAPQRVLADPQADGVLRETADATSAWASDTLAALLFSSVTACAPASSGCALASKLPAAANSDQQTEYLPCKRTDSCQSQSW
ncbi:hypothetical protein [Stenotrophomonas maltophilia]|uniref:hypothetical protein n=1 Tax=Stenotrophomonas maltophilia TaxID=40324 RepID=UPI0013DCC155|nr:hypothetical protein [Stenotrophomonas maltophilia]